MKTLKQRIRLLWRITDSLLEKLLRMLTYQLPPVTKFSGCVIHEICGSEVCPKISKFWFCFSAIFFSFLPKATLCHNHRHRIHRTWPVRLSPIRKTKKTDQEIWSFNPIEEIKTGNHWKSSRPNVAYQYCFADWKKRRHTATTLKGSTKIFLNTHRIWFRVF